MKKTNKKGFTLVELVIVIAVIAILAGVLIGTFASVIKRANQSAEVQNIKNAEIAQKADDIIKKIEESNWFGWEDFETEIVTAVAKAVKENTSNAQLDINEIKAVVEETVITALANIKGENTGLKEEQLKAIVENAMGSLKYEGVTEAQVRAIVNGATATLLGNELTAAQVRAIVNAANEKNLTAVQLANIMASQLGDFVTVTELSNKMSDLQTLITNTSATLADKDDVQDILDAIDEFKNNTLSDDLDDVITAKALNIRIKGAGLTKANTPYEVFEAISFEVVPTKKTILLSIEKDQLGFFVVNEAQDTIINPCGLTVTPLSYKYWTFSSSVSTEYSTYLTGTTYDTTVIANGVGVDVGTANVTAINYTSNTGREVVIRTNGGTLTINAENDEVTHYGQVDYVDIIAVKPASYKERGTSSLIKVAKGNVALSSESKVGEIHFAKTDNVFTDIKVTLENGAKLPDVSRDPVGTSLVNDILVCEVVTSGTSEYYWLSGNATIEDEKVLVSADKEGTNKVAATAQNSTAVAIANAKTGVEVTDNGATVKAATEMTAEEIVEAAAAGAAKTFAEIGSKEELKAFRDAWNAGKLAAGTFKLTANIDISGENWYPIGSWEFPFNGTFDGNNKTINGLYANSADAEHKATYANNSSVGFGETFGFFGIVGNGALTVKNVTFTNVNINIFDGKNVGAVIGYAPSNAKFQNSTKTKDLLDKDHKGDSMVEIEPYKSSSTFVGKWNTNTEIGKHNITLSGVTVQGSVQGKSHVAGIVGKAYTAGDIKFEDCTNNADVTSNGGFCGGIVGILSSNTNKIDATDCYNNGNITNSGGDVSGLFGEFAPSTSAIINVTNCHNTGTVIRSGDGTNNYGVAGVLYIAKGSVATLKNLSNSGAVFYTSNYNNTSASGIFVCNATDTILTGSIENSGNVTGHVRVSGIGSFGRTQLKSVTIKNSGDIAGSNVSSNPFASATYVGGLTSSFSGTLTSEGTCTFENTGNISANAVWGKTFAGGAFGYYQNGSTTSYSFPLIVNVHDCSITAIGAGQEFHSSSRSGNDDMKCDPVGAGGFAGRVDARMVTFDKVTVDHVSLSATKTANVKVFDKAVENPGSFFFAGAFAGLLEVRSSTHVYETNLTNCILTNNSFTATSSGLVVGCSYNANTTIEYEILRFAGTIDAETDMLKYDGRVYNNATIALAE